MRTGMLPACGAGVARSRRSGRAPTRRSSPRCSACARSQPRRRPLARGADVPDSYDLLARSIERVIRSDLPLPLSPDVLASSIDRIMIEESCAGELRLSYLRVLVVAVFVVLAVDAAVRG